jgi:hypothetical protein
MMSRSLPRFHWLLLLSSTMSLIPETEIAKWRQRQRCDQKPESDGAEL